MAKGKKSRGKSGEAPGSETGSSDAGAAESSAPSISATAAASKELQEAIAVFNSGDYARARNMLLSKANDPSLSEGAKEHARAMIGATRMERGTLYVGLACVALAALVVIVTSLTQPHS